MAKRLLQYGTARSIAVHKQAIYKSLIDGEMLIWICIRAIVINPTGVNAKIITKKTKEILANPTCCFALAFKASPPKQKKPRAKSRQTEFIKWRTA